MKTTDWRARAGLVPLLCLALLAGLLPACTARPPYVLEGCVRQDLGGRSVARVWNEVLLDMIRQVIPAPTVHARNLFHFSAATWDAWAAYDTEAHGYLVTEKQRADDVLTAREAAISFAAYRILAWRYGEVSDLATAEEALDATLASLCYDKSYTAAEGDLPAALGNRIAAAVLEFGRQDGSNEAERYADASYRPANEPLIVDEPGAPMLDPNRWQPLALERQLSQNNLPIPGNVQTFIGPHWGRVTSFAMPPSEQGIPIDPGSPPRLHDALTDARFKEEALDVIRRSNELDADNGVTLDISPGALGGNSLGANDGTGHARNPATGQPYPANVALRADYARALAEYWADGPRSETPPGHWNVIANEASDALGDNLRLGGQGEPLDRLEWDVKLYFALNGATHDAAIAAWGLKGHYDSARPISMIRYMGAVGQSSEPAGPAYHPDGLPLVEGLVEVVTAESSAAGERHEHLAGHAGEIAIRAWNGFPADPENETSGVGWIRAVQWVPYQRDTFVTPAFAGFVSGHSTFSRAAAEVLTAFTGSEFFPGGVHEHHVGAGEFLHEEGPTADITLQWATYYDAADQAGVSRLYMGIHIPADDLEGRKIGADCGILAWELVQRYFDGTAGS
ncbi:MAG TPA: vanadium-dependent haloperoxidase [Candidatus Limnocylindria bacterium]|nr:vanadium-dependent haloperoxidase [Candidatus Limnocylindria bacterium]